jgi:hypothetical protein
MLLDRFLIKGLPIMFKGRSTPLRWAIVLVSCWTMMLFPVASAANITVTGDPIGGGQLSGSVFTIGNGNGTGGSNSWPAAESPNLAIDNTVSTKYLNFGISNTGFIVTPAFGSSNVTGIHFDTANDSIERDPASYVLYGSNTVVANGTVGATFNLSDFTQIASGTLSLPTTRLDTTTSISFGNTGNYTTYLLVFPTVRTPASANSMQIGDAILTGTGPLSISNWISTADTNWETGANWNPATVPNAASVLVNVGSTGVIGTIDLGATNKTVGVLTFAGPVPTTIGSTSGNKLILDNGATAAGVNVNGANNVISSAVQLNSNTTVTLGGTLAMSNTISDGGAGKALTVAGTGVLTLTGANTYTGGTKLNGGVANVTPGALGTTGNITFGGGVLQYAAASTPEDLSGRFKNSTGAIKVDLNGLTATYASAIDSSNTGGLQLSSSAAGAVVNLNAANSYTGANSVGTNVTVNLGSANAFGANGTNLAVNGGTVNLNGNSISVGALSGTGGTITDNSGTAGTTTIAVNQTTTTTFAGSITKGATRDVNLTLTGGGNLTISGPVSLGANVPTISGNSTLNLANNANQLGSGAILVSTGNTLSAGSGVAASSSALGGASVHLTGGTLNLNTANAALTGFGGNGTGWTANNGPTVTADDLTITQNVGSQNRSFFYNTKQPISNFTASFTYKDVTTNGADGFAFVLQNDPRGLTALGDAGGALGYGGGPIITPSAAAEFNIYSGNTNSSGRFATNGATGGYTAFGSVNIDSGDPIRITLAYNGTTLTETLLDLTNNNTYTTSTPVDLATVLGAATAYVGFTGGTGGATAQQDITNFVYSTGASQVVYGNNVTIDTSNSTINSPSSNSVLGTVSFDPNLTLNISGKVRATATNFTNNGGTTYTFNVTSGEYDLGQPTNANSVTQINKTGSGALVLDFTSSSTFTNVTKFNVTGGTLALVGLTGDASPNPLGGAKIQLGIGTNVALALSSKGGNIDFDNVQAIITDNATITAGQYGSGVVGTAASSAFVAPPLTVNYNATAGQSVVGSKTLTLNSTDNYVLNMAGVISEIGTGANLAVNGGWVNLSAQNTITGNVNVTAGTLGYNNVNALTTASAINVSGTGVVDALVANANLAKVVVATGGTLRLSADQATGVAPTAAIAGTLSINADVSAGFNTTISSGGTVRAVGANHSLGSNLSLQGGNVNFGGPANANNLTITGTVKNGTSAGGVIVNGTGNISFNGTSSYTGATAVNSGTLSIGASGLPSTSGITVGGNGSNSTLNLNGAVPTAAIVANSQGTVNAAAAGAIGAGGVTANAGATVNITQAGAVAGGALVANNGTININSAGTQSASSITVQNDGSVANFLTGVLNINPGATNTATINSSGTILNNSLIHASTGTADFGTQVITTTMGTASYQPFTSLTAKWNKPSDIQPANSVADFLTAATGDPQITFSNAVNFHTSMSTQLTTLVKAPLSYKNGNDINTASNNYFAAAGGSSDNDGAAWYGSFTLSSAQAGYYSFGTNSDDGSSIWVDGAQVVGNYGPHGDVQVVGVVSLAAGTHTIEIGWYNGNGGQDIEARYSYNGTTNNVATAFASQYIIDPGTFVSGGGQVQVDAGATLKAGGVSAAIVNLNGSSTDAATLTLNNNASNVASAIETLNVAGTTPLATFNVGNNNAVTIQNVNLAAGASLTIAGSSPTTSVVNIITGSTFGGTNSTINLTGGKINYQANDVGTTIGQLNVSGGGVLAGTGTIGANVTIGSGGVLNPGGFGSFIIPMNSAANASLNLNAGAVLSYALSNSVQGTSHSSPGASNQFNVGVGGSLLFPSSGSVTLNLTGSVPTVAQGSTAYYELFSYGSAGAVANFNGQTNYSFASQSPTNSIQLGTGFSSAPSTYTYTLVNDMGAGGVFLDISNAFAATADGTWTGAVDATWQNNGNWTPAKPSGAGAAAIFSGAGSGSPIVLGQDRTIGSLQLSGADYTIGAGGGSSLILDNTGGSGNATITASSGNQLIVAPVVVLNTNLDINESFGGLTLQGGLTVSSGKTANLKEANSAPLMITNVTNNGTLNAATGTTTVGNVTGSGSTTVANNAKLIANQFVQSSLTVHGDSTHTTAKATVATSGANSAGDPNQVSVLNSLSIDNDGGALGSRNYYGTVDLKNNDIIINNASPGAATTTLASVADMARAGQSGNGLMTSSGDTITGLGVINNTNGLTTFDNVSIDGNATLVKYTFFGDLNLDGKVDGNEIAAAVNGFNLHLGGWANGDANYSGQVDGNDIAAIVNAFNGQNGHNAPLPEPSTLVLAGLGLLGLLAARRRRKS